MFFVWGLVVKMRASGSAYQPEIMGLPVMVLLFGLGFILRVDWRAVMVEIIDRRIMEYIVVNDDDTLSEEI